MARPKSRGPTERELVILQILWERGPCTVREVYEALPQGIEAGYTSLQKIMQIMADKGLVMRDTSSHAHVYQAAQDESVTQEGIVGDLLERVFRGSAMSLVAKALSAKPTSKGELAAIRQLLEEAEREQHEP
jgi:predicted transcriptional regulator